MKKLLIGAVGVFLVSGCAGLMMSVTDRNEAANKIILKQGDSVAILPVQANEETITSGWNDTFSSQLQSQLLTKLTERGVQANMGNSGEKTLQIQLTRYKKGSGFCRAFFPVFGLGDSYLDGDAVLMIGTDKRELEVKKRAQKTGFYEMDDQTVDNISYFATALAAELTATSEEK